jgi:hypothetical protein
MSVSEHLPTIPKNTAEPTMIPLATPTRQMGDQSNLADMLGTMRLNKGKTPEMHAMSFSNPMTPAGLTYLPSANTGFGAPLGFPVPTGAVYTSGNIGTMGMGSMLTGMTQQSTFPMANSMTNFGPFAQTSYANHHGSPIQYSQPEFGNPMGHMSFAASNPNYGSPSPGSSRYIGYSPRPAGPIRRQNAVKVPYHIAATYRRNQNSNNSGNHNFVDLDNIRFGSDVRTTVSFSPSISQVMFLISQVMLRNIPNKVTQAELKKYVDESSFGRYDFMYLRIDFSNDCK